MAMFNPGQPPPTHYFSCPPPRVLELEPKGPDLHAEDKKDSAFDRAEREQRGSDRREPLDVEPKRNLDHIRDKDKELQGLIESFRRP